MNDYVSPFSKTDPFHIDRVQVADTIHAIEMDIHSHIASDFFMSLAQSLALRLGVAHALVSEFLGDQLWSVQTRGLWIDDHFGTNYSYSLLDTPCAKVMKGTTCYYPTGIQVLFPRDMDLRQLKAQSYLGVPVLDSNGEIIGHLVIMDTKPMKEQAYLRTVLKFFADRVGEALELARATR